MKVLMLLAVVAGSIYASESVDMDGRSTGMSPKVFVRDTSFAQPTVREVAVKAPEFKANEFILDGFDYHQDEIKPWDILMEGNVDFRVDGL